MPQPWKAVTPVDRLAAQLANMQAQLTALNAAGVHIPVVDADPDASQYSSNVWMFDDGRLRIRKSDGTVVQLATAASTGSTSGVTPTPPPAAPRTFQTVYSATFSQTYQGSGSQRNEDKLHVGYSDSYNGRQTSIVGFNQAAIASDLTGAAVHAVELYLYCTHCWWNSGAQVYVGGNTSSSAPGSLGGIVFSGTSIIGVKGADQRAAQGYHPISTAFGGWLRSGAIHSITLQAPNNNQSYYSIHGGVGSGLPVPALRITYVK
jgi:hypothetical protein